MKKTIHRKGYSYVNRYGTTVNCPPITYDIEVTSKRKEGAGKEYEGLLFSDEETRDYSIKREYQKSFPEMTVTQKRKDAAKTFLIERGGNFKAYEFNQQLRSRLLAPTKRNNAMVARWVYKYMPEFVPVFAQHPEYSEFFRANKLRTKKK